MSERTPEQIAAIVAWHQRPRGPVNPPPAPRLLAPGTGARSAQFRQWPFASPQGATKEERRADALRLKQEAVERQQKLDEERAERAAALARMERDSG